MYPAADPYTVFQEDLRPGERLLWTGQPNPNKLLSVADVFMIPFSLMWGGFAFFWEAMAIGMYLKTPNFGPGIFFPLFGLPFCAIGFWLIFGRFITLYNTRRRTYYGVTDQRLIFVTMGSQRGSQFIPIDHELNMQKSVRPDGSGTLTFGNTQVPAWASNLPMRRQSAAQIPQFAEISDLPNVAAIIDRQQAALPKGNPQSASLAS
ncbi:MAG: hypothetical protein QOJ65_1999 [Fimbriimonadaceae bacterium]|jgi:hypothetical protein|nr:hypothetical protein [Fimbriimonadaceae bacterium]